ncbi:MAG: phosphoribosylformylglycinamidine synthase subunit PurS [Pseudomonadota bacterium]|nr:phosphoribosylformylglycinamidine synthase subunit PurS [Pseudomonadota bacterium]
MRAIVEIFLKPGVLDVQGKAVENALRGLGWDDVANVRVGRLITLDLSEADRAAANSRVEMMCERLLANPLIEDYEIVDS